jgi:hypothetical protein
MILTQKTLNLLRFCSFSGRADVENQDDIFIVPSKLFLSGRMSALPRIHGHKEEMLQSLWLYKNAEGQLARASANLRSARSEYDRIKRIRQSDPGAASESMLVQRLEAVDTARADIAALTASVQAAQNRLDDTNLTAPFDGYISKRYVENFRKCGLRSLFSVLIF